jgi:hypothetical protein
VCWGAPYPVLAMHLEAPLKIVKKMLDGRKMDEVDIYQELENVQITHAILHYCDHTLAAMSWSIRCGSSWEAGGGGGRAPYPVLAVHPEAPALLPRSPFSEPVVCTG